MALKLYNNGIIDEVRPCSLTFTEAELVSNFTTASKIKTMRVLEIPNTWCIFGEYVKGSDNDYNALASESVDEDIIFHVLYVHDSELNPEWNMTDEVLLKTYDDFYNDMFDYLNKLAAEFMKNENKEENEGEESEGKLVLESLGTTKDKKILFLFDINAQDPSFFSDGSFVNFSNKIVSHLLEEKKIAKNPIIFKDSKIVITVKPELFKHLMEKIVIEYQRKEEYEICHKLKTMTERWENLGKSKIKVKK